MGGGGREKHVFPSRTFVSLVKKFVGEPFGSVHNFEFLRILRLGEFYHDFLSNFFCLTVPRKFIN